MEELSNEFLDFSAGTKYNNGHGDGEGITIGKSIDTGYGHGHSLESAICDGYGCGDCYGYYKQDGISKGLWEPI